MKVSRRSAFFTLTKAPTTGLPEASLTTPCTEPRSSAAKAEWVATKATPAAIPTARFRVTFLSDMRLSPYDLCLFDLCLFDRVVAPLSGVVAALQEPKLIADRPAASIGRHIRDFRDSCHPGFRASRHAPTLLVRSAGR